MGEDEEGRIGVLNELVLFGFMDLYTERIVEVDMEGIAKML